jgi:O-antigen/teichoic acid export membrane protein
MAVVSGTVTSQALVFLLSPLLARLFVPTDFGALANYNAWVSFLGMISNLRYEQAMIVARGRIAMNRVMALALMLSFASALMLAVAAVIIYRANSGSGYLHEIRDVVLLIPAGMLTMVVISLLTMFSTKRGRFRQLATMALTQAALTASFQILFGYVRVAHGLVLGALVGTIGTAIAFVAWHLRRNRVQHVWRELRPRQLVATARENVSFPRYVLAADSIFVVVQQFVPVILTAMFSPAIAGIYAFSTRVVRVPAFVISTSVLTVLRKHAPDRLVEEGGLWKLFKTTVTTLSIIAIGPFIVLMFFARSVFGFVFGAQWVEAGSVVQILTPGMLLEFVAMPLAVIFIVTRTQRYSFALQMMNMTLLATALVLGRYVWHDFIMTCVVVSVAMVCVNALTIALASRACRSTTVPDVAPAVAS